MAITGSVTNEKKFFGGFVVSFFISFLILMCMCTVEANAAKTDNGNLTTQINKFDFNNFLVANSLNVTKEEAVTEKKTEKTTTGSTETTKTATTKTPGQPVVTLKAGKNNDMITVTIGKTKNTTAYQIFLRENSQKKYKKIKTLKKDGTAKRTFKIKNLVPGKTYCVIVKAMNGTGNKAVYGEKSIAKKLKLGIKRDLSALPVSIDEKTFPDEVFREYVSDVFDNNGDGILSGEERARVTAISVSTRGLSGNLQGIEVFHALEYLDCSDNELSNLDLSNNTALKYLDCHHNKVVSLDLSKNTELEELDCSQNELTRLDVSKNIKLNKIVCTDNQIRGLDVSKNTVLETLDCGWNSLNSLYVGDNAELKYLDCYYNGLMSLDLSGATGLESLTCTYNEIRSLDLINNTELVQLFCSANKLKKLDLSNNIKLTVLQCWYNDIRSLDLTNNTYLENPCVSCDSGVVLTYASGEVVIR